MERVRLILAAALVALVLVASPAQAQTSETNPSSIGMVATEGKSPPWIWQALDARPINPPLLDVWIGAIEECTGETRPEGELVMLQAYVLYVQLFNTMGFDQVKLLAGFYSTPETNEAGVHYVLVADRLPFDLRTYTLLHELMHYVTRWHDDDDFEAAMERCFGPAPEWSGALMPTDSLTTSAAEPCDGQDHNLFSERCRR